jgi:hypothetical protein
MEENCNINSCIPNDPLYEELYGIIQIQIQLTREKQLRQTEAIREALFRMRCINSNLKRERYFNPY